MERFAFTGLLGACALLGAITAHAAMDMDGGDHPMAMCGDAAAPLMSVADLDLSGRVDVADAVMLLRHVVTRQPYRALFDRDGDGRLTVNDVLLTAEDIGRRPTAVDIEVGEMYRRFEFLQDIQGEEALTARGYFPIPVALKGHGVHWFNQDGLHSMLGLKAPNPMIAEGLNVDTEHEDVHAVFYAYPAVPVFENADGENVGQSDWPDGEVWKDQRVIAFANTPMPVTSHPLERWHAHAGLCMTVEHQMDENGKVVRVGHAKQFLTYNECQAEPNDEPQPDNTNMWATFWMVHVWMFDLNPNGLFAGTHPCVEPNGLDESTINGDREVPPFFAHMH